MTGNDRKDEDDRPLPSDAEDEERTVIARFNPLYGTHSGREEQPAAAPEPPDEPLASEPPEPDPTDGLSGTPETTENGARRSKLEIGTVINGNYQIVEQLKSGGMGRVFRGVTLGNDLEVAIKTVRAELADDPKYGDMFRNESKLLGSLRDDAIVNYLNFQYDAVLNRWFLVMEFISGESLSEYIERNGKITLAQASRLFRRLATGLAKAHERNVIHRDLSPDNVMLRNGELNQAVLIDFGIARSVIEQTNKRSAFAGKLRYAAPEQLGMYDGIIGPQTDVYGLGLLMIAALTGAPLSMGRSLQAAADARRQVPDLSNVPIPFRPLLAQMLQPAPADRPDGMHGVIANLPNIEGTSSGTTRGSLDMDSDLNPPVPGLRRPPRNVRPLTTSATGTLGTGLQHSTAHSQVTGTLPPAGQPSEMPRKSRLPGLLLGLALLAGAGGAGYYYMNDGALLPKAADDSAASEIASIPPENAFLAEFDLGFCTHVALQQEGEPDAGKLAVFAGTPVDLAPLVETYEAEFPGPIMDVAERIVAPDQCAVLAAARQMQAYTVDPIQIRVEPTTSAELRASAVDAQNRNIWLGVVNRDGHLRSLHQYRTGESSAGGEFILKLNPAAQTYPFLIVALATPEALVETAMVPGSGIQAETFFARIELELAEEGIRPQSAMRILYIPAP